MELHQLSGVCLDTEGIIRFNAEYLAPTLKKQHPEVSLYLGTITYTPEYFAVKHYSHYIQAGTRVLAYKAAKDDKLPVMISQTPQKKFVITAGNFNGETKEVTLKLGKRYLSVTLPAHSMNTFTEK